MRHLLRVSRVSRAWACAALMVGCTATPVPPPSSTVATTFYQFVIDSSVDGIPTATQMAQLEPMLSTELLALLQAARRLHDSMTTAFPDEKPPFAEGSLFTSLFEGPGSMTVVSDSAAADVRRVAVRFSGRGAAASTTWVDTVLVMVEHDQPVVADVRYGGTLEFANRGSLLQALRAATTPRPESAWTVRMNGIGPIEIGMSIGEAVSLIGGTSRIERIEPEDQCGHVYLTAAPEGVWFMVAGDTIVRVEIGTADLVTIAGIRVGDLESSVIARLPGTRIEPHPYEGPEGHYLVFDGPDGSPFRMILATDGRVVTSLRTGRPDAVDLIEGCA